MDVFESRCLLWAERSRSIWDGSFQRMSWSVGRCFQGNGLGILWSRGVGSCHWSVSEEYRTKYRPYTKQEREWATRRTSLCCEYIYWKMPRSTSSCWSRETNWVLIQNVEHHFAQHIDESGTIFHHFEESEVLYTSVKILCLQGDEKRDEAKHTLQHYFDIEMTMDMCGGNVVHCHQRHGESAQLLKCAGCKVKYYCNRSHQEKKWRGRFIGHKTLCPFLQKWRRVKKNMKAGKRSRNSLEWLSRYGWVGVFKR